MSHLYDTNDKQHKVVSVIQTQTILNIQSDVIIVKTWSYT